MSDPRQALCDATSSPTSTWCLPFAHRKPMERFSPPLQGLRPPVEPPCRKLASVVPRPMPANRLPVSSCDALSFLYLTFPFFQASLVVGSWIVSRCLNASPLWELERCMKDADHCPCHPAVHFKGPRNKGSDVQNVRSTHFSFLFSTFFSRSWAYGIDSSRPAAPAPPFRMRETLCTSVGFS